MPIPVCDRFDACPAVVAPYVRASDRDEGALAHALARDLRRRLDAARWLPALSLHVTLRHALTSSLSLFDPLDARTRITAPEGLTLELFVRWNLDPSQPRLPEGDL